MNWLDLLIVVLAALAGAAGYRMGLVAVDLVVWPRAGCTSRRGSSRIVLDGHEAAPEGRLLLAAASILVIGGLAGQALGMFVGSHLRRTLPHGSVSTFDRGGAFAGMLGVFVALWLLLPAIAEVPDWPARQACMSAIARAIDGLFPTPPDAVDAIRQLVDDTSPEVFAGPKPAPDVPAPPDSIVVASIVNDQATALCSASRPRVRAHPGGQRLHRRSGPHRHERGRRRGSTDVSVHGEHGEDETASVVAFDPFRDVALLAGRRHRRDAAHARGAFSG